MNSTLVKILKAREDLSDYLFHFTSGATAERTLAKIVEANSLIDIKNKGVFCFTEAPLTALPEMFKIFDSYRSPMYAPYGIAVKKDYLFGIGGRPVIYGLMDEKEHLSEEIQWRFEDIKPDVKDFSWLREWRIKGTTLQIDSENFFIITKHKSELEDHMFNPEDVIDVVFDGCVADGGFMGDATGVTARRFKGISIEELEQLESMSKNEIDKILASQSFDDTGGVYLGGFIL
ncbi:hypothetical protein OGH69_14550 [Flavobacterium sp. MFBS3-15]|uniref:hypothetical protein n=1 Tax=Flavobacterium sp. MFBS3-15 TaxID=2989816 RepID=UPI002235DC6A|nr:hypothetical protein [Flavobacterium sp. MFBS3-15]MCW4470195.1 hypothetical protein [Flavobacterium sp. MFBS3-15]